jgi:hypothetical protein
MFVLCLGFAFERFVVGGAHLSTASQCMLMFCCLQLFVAHLDFGLCTGFCVVELCHLNIYSDCPFGVHIDCVCEHFDLLMSRSGLSAHAVFFLL